MISCLSVNVMFSDISMFGTLYVTKYFFQGWINLIIFVVFVYMSLSLQVQG